MTMSREIDVRSHNAVAVMRAKEQRPQKRLSECDNVQCSDQEIEITEKVLMLVPKASRE